MTVWRKSEFLDPILKFFSRFENSQPPKAALAPPLPTLHFKIASLLIFLTLKAQHNEISMNKHSRVRTHNLCRLQSLFSITEPVL